MNIVVAGLFLFWGVYFSLAGTGNFLDLMNVESHRGKYFRFSSNNYELMQKVVKRFSLSRAKLNAIFTLIMCWEMLSAVSYIASFFLYIFGNSSISGYSYFIGMGLFAALTIGNEAFVFYEDEEEHVVMLVAQLISYIAFYLLK